MNNDAKYLAQIKRIINHMQMINQFRLLLFANNSHKMIPMTTSSLYENEITEAASAGRFKLGWLAKSRGYLLHSNISVTSISIERSILLEFFARSVRLICNKVKSVLQANQTRYDGLRVKRREKFLSQGPSIVFAFG